MTSPRMAAIDSTAENPHAGQGMVVLDIGGDIGALIVSAPAELAGAEIEICPAGQRGREPDEGGDWWQGSWRWPAGHDHSDGQSHSDGHSHSDRHEYVDGLERADGHSHPGKHGHSHDAGPAWPHVAVLARPTPNGDALAAVFPGLVDGVYEVWVRPVGPTAVVARVRGGHVEMVDWPAPGNGTNDDVTRHPSRP